jgi:hypothetical protein
MIFVLVVHMWSSLIISSCPMCNESKRTKFDPPSLLLGLLPLLVVVVVGVELPGQRDKSQIHSLTEVAARVDSVVAQLLLDAEDLVELGQTLRTSGSTSLDLAGSQTHGDVGNRHILGLTRTVGHHDPPAGSVRVLGSLDGLGQGTDLVDLQEQGVARLEFNSLLDAQGVGHGQVVTDA